MILKPFKVHSHDGKTFYEGDPPVKLSDDLAHAKAVMEGRAPVFVRIDAEAAPTAAVLDDERTAFIRAYMAARPASVAQAGDVFDQDWHGKQMWSAGIAYARAASPQPVAQTAQINQCDGCRSNSPLTERGIHRYADGSLIGCTKDRYPVAQPVEQTAKSAEIDLKADDVFTLIGHAETLRGTGQADMPKWFLELARKIAIRIGDKGLVSRVVELLSESA